LEICYFDSLASTHKYVCELLANKEKNPPFLVYANKQTKGIGSRGNSWQSTEGNLHVSICVHTKHLPKDLPLVSASIYAGMIIKEILNKKGSKVWLKWPNDLYLDKSKIGGVMTLKSGDLFIISIGLNLRQSPPGFGVLDIDVTAKECVDELVATWKNLPSWKNIFSKYRLEFQRSKLFVSHNEADPISLKDALLCEDGSIMLGNKKVYSLR
jgi:BirA family biotin operon repressor/biotin-[acetyl-CoA-carboxylase] ligase